MRGWNRKDNYLHQLSCSPWGGLLFDPVVQRHTKRRRKRQDPTDRIERGRKMERHMNKQEGMKSRQQEGDIGLVLDTMPPLNNHDNHNGIDQKSM